MADVQAQPAAAAAPTPAKRFTMNAVMKPFKSRKNGAALAPASQKASSSSEKLVDAGSAVEAHVLDKDAALARSSNATSLDYNQVLAPGPPSAKADGRRVSFSPSVEEAAMAKEMLEDEQATAAARSATLPRKQRSRGVRFPLRRSSHPTKAGKAGKQARHEQNSLRVSTSKASKRRSVAFVWKEDGIHHDPNAAATTAAARAPKAKVTKQQAIASRHARMLEQLMNGNVDLAKAALQQRASSAKPGKAKGSSNSGHLSEEKAQAAKAKQLKKLKAALLDTNLANSIIGELRVMDVDPTSAAVKEHGLDRLLFASPANAGAPVESTASESAEPSPATLALQEALAASIRPSSTSRMICLDCDESTALTRHAEVLALDATEAASPPAAEAGPSGTSVKAVGAFSIAIGAGYLASWLPWRPVAPAKAAAAGKEASVVRVSAAATSAAPVLPSALARLPQLPEVPTLLGVSPISLVMSPKTTIVTAGADKLGAFNAMASISGAVIEASGTNVGLVAPTDRMSIFVHWWGFEVALPAATLAYLGTAQNISSSFLGFLQTMAISGGIPELIPFIRYISMFVDVEFKAIAAQNKGNGVVIAAVWAFPMALVPRPWDFAAMPAAPPAPAAPSPAPSTPAPSSAPASALPPVAAVQVPPRGAASRSAAPVLLQPLRSSPSAPAVTSPKAH